MEQDSGNLIANVSERDIIATATCGFTANDNKPWEVSIEIGTSLKVLDSTTKWWQVENNGRIGYAPAKCFKLLNPENPIHSNVEKKNSIETDHVENGCKSEEHESAGITDKKSSGTDFVETSERRRSSRLAQNPALIPRKKSRQDSSWTAALERNQQQNKTSAELFKTHSKKGRALVGPRDLMVAPGLREKVSIFPDIPNPVKKEKVEPPDYESDNSESPQIAFSCSTDKDSRFPVQRSSVATIEESAVELETVIVKNEVDFDDSSSELQSDITDEFECGPSLCSIFSSAAANQEESSPLQSSSLECAVTEIAPVCFASTSTPELKATSDPTTSPLPTSSKLLSLESLPPDGQPLIRSDPIPLDNSSNPCCVLFHKVWAVVGLRYNPVSSNSEINKPPNIALVLRLVCQDWRAGVDKFYESLAVSFHDENFKFNLRKPKHYNCAETFLPTTVRAYAFNMKNDSIIRFLSHFQYTHCAHGPMSVQRQKSKNPIIGRIVSFRGRIRSNTEWAKVESMMAELLGKYGRHIWYCMMHIDEVECDTTRHMGNVNKWLQFMPNLKHLTWKSETRMLTTVEATQKLLKFITQAEWPEMKHLNRVNFESFEVASEIDNAFLLKNCHISALKTNKLPDSVVLSNLKHLRLKIYSKLMFKRFEMSFHHWPLLERIQLIFMAGTSGISSEGALKVLQLWKNTLTHVSIRLCRHEPDLFDSDLDCDYNYDVEGSEFRRLPYRLDLPRVKYFKMDLSRDVMLLQDASLDFLFPLRASLEHLHLEYRTIFSYCDCEVTYDNNLRWQLPSNKQLPFSFHYGSNIWNIFIKLRKVYVRSGNKKFRVHTYSREEWFSKRHTTPKVKRPYITFGVAKCDEFQTSTLNEQYELPVKGLLFAWRNLNNINEEDLPEREKILKQHFTISLKEYAKEGIFPNLMSYDCYDKQKDGTEYNNRFCTLCRKGTLKTSEHFMKCHFLFGGEYKCDYAGCDEAFVSKYDVVQHRMSHGEKHSRVYYELEAVPMRNLATPEYKQLFNWIHSDQVDHLLTLTEEPNYRT